jgi:hypothetical protein
MVARALHDLVDHELRVTSNIEVSDPLVRRCFVGS